MTELPPPFSCETTTTEEGVVVKPVGEVDLATAGHLEAALEQAATAGSRRTVLDLTEVTFLDSSGLRVILAADAAARANGSGLLIVRGRPMVHRVFEVAGLTEHLDFAGGQI